MIARMSINFFSINFFSTNGGVIKNLNKYVSIDPHIIHDEKMIHSTKIIHIMGPTASGKTALSFALAERLPIEIISVDSALVYQGLDIGSAKPSAALRATVPHHLIDVRSPEQPYSVAAFLQDAQTAIRAIQARHHIPVLVGGTMLYFKALLSGLADIPVVPCDIQRAIEQRLATTGLAPLYEQLAQADPRSAARIHQHDTQRITRALAVFEATGQPLSFWLNQSQQGYPLEHVLQLSLIPEDRMQLQALLAKRFHEMMEQGLVAEVQGLQKRYQLHEGLPSMRAVGYRQVWQYLAGMLTTQQMIEQSMIASRRLAKRQLTWLRSWQNHMVLPAYHADVVEQAYGHISVFLR